MTDFEYVPVVDGGPTSRDLRVEVCGRVGTNQSHYLNSGLTKRTLNSLVAYLTGHFAVQPKRLHVEGAKRKEAMMVEVASVCGLEDWMGKYDDWDKHGAWVDEDGNENTSLPRFTKADLEAILEQMVESGDQRDWV